MTAFGRKQPFASIDFQGSERPLWMKADIQIRTSENAMPSDRYTPESGR